MKTPLKVELIYIYIKKKRFKLKYTEGEKKSNYSSTHRINKVTKAQAKHSLLV